MPLDNLFKKIERIERFDIAKETCDIINENGDFISDLLRAQLAKGKDGQGKEVTVFGRDFYSDRTVFEKERHGVGLGKETRWITNYMTGVFHNSIYVYASGTKFFFDSGVPYLNEILAQSGPKILELGKEGLEIFRDRILIPQLQLRFKNSLNGL